MQVDIRQGFDLTIKENGICRDKDDYVIQFYQGDNICNFRFSKLKDIIEFNIELAKLESKILIFIERELDRMREKSEHTRS